MAHLIDQPIAYMLGGAPVSQDFACKGSCVLGGKNTPEAIAAQQQELISGGNVENLDVRDC